MTYSLEFIGGLVCGEGCFSLSVNKLRQSRGAGWLRVTPVFSMTMCDLEVMNGVADSFREYGLPVYVRDVFSPSRLGNRPALRIHVNGQARLLKITEALLPHLYGDKKKAAQAVHDFCLHRLTRVGEFNPKHPKRLGYRGIDDFDIDCIERCRDANRSNREHVHSIADLRDYKMGRAKRARKI